MKKHSLDLKKDKNYYELDDENSSAIWKYTINCLGLITMTTVRSCAGLAGWQVPEIVRTYIY